jgi:hypothetical protein
MADVKECASGSDVIVGLFRVGQKCLGSHANELPHHVSDKLR